MNIPSKQFDLALAHQAMFKVVDPAGLRIVCREGSLWITLDGDPRDIVLSAGDSFAATEHRRALIYALAPSTLSLAMMPCAAPARRVGPAHVASGAQVSFALPSA